jgi:hypothetical protein
MTQASNSGHLGRAVSISTQFKIQPRFSQNVRIGAGCRARPLTAGSEDQDSYRPTNGYPVDAAKKVRLLVQGRI